MRALFGKMLVVDAWRNVDDGEPMPAWMNDVACWLEGGRFAVETRTGTSIAEMGDWIVRGTKGEAYVWPPEALAALYEEAP